MLCFSSGLVRGSKNAFHTVSSKGIFGCFTKTQHKFMHFKIKIVKRTFESKMKARPG